MASRQAHHPAVYAYMDSLEPQARAEFQESLTRSWEQWQAVFGQEDHAAGTNARTDRPVDRSQA